MIYGGGAPYDNGCGRCEVAAGGVGYGTGADRKDENLAR